MKYQLIHMYHNKEILLSIHSEIESAILKAESEIINEAIQYNQKVLIITETIVDVLIRNIYSDSQYLIKKL